MYMRREVEFLKKLTNGNTESACERVAWALGGLGARTVCTVPECTVKRIMIYYVTHHS